MASSYDSPLNLLVSWPYFKGGILSLVCEHRDRLRLLVDSGAFTAWKAGKTLVLDDYCAFLDALPVTPWRYFTLDIIGDAISTRQQYDEMRERGYTPVPVFTRGDDPHDLDYYYETSDVVALGGLVGTKGNREFVKGIMEYVGTRKVHWLGFTAHPFLLHYRPFMCDTSSWASSDRFGGNSVNSLQLYMGRGKFHRSGMAHFENAPERVVADKIRSYGVDPRDLGDVTGWRGVSSANRKLNAASVVRYSLDLERNLGVRYFLSAPEADRARLAIEAHAREVPVCQAP